MGGLNNFILIVGGLNNFMLLVIKVGQVDRYNFTYLCGRGKFNLYVVRMVGLGEVGRLNVQKAKV